MTTDSSILAQEISLKEEHVGLQPTGMNQMNDIDEFDESKLEEDFDWEEGENMFADDEEDIFGEDEEEYYEDESFDEPYDDPYDRY